MNKDKELALLQEAGNKALEQLIERYGWYSEDGPLVHWDDSSLTITWECGPPSWALGDTYWMHEEVMSMAQEFGVATPPFKASDYKPFWDGLDGFFYEPYNSYTLTITLDGEVRG